MAQRGNTKDKQMRERIAQEAARLMAEEGMHDFYAAKRKAAQHLGAPDTRNMPRNSEIEEALLAYQRLFQADEQPLILRRLRETALRAMHFLRTFEPRLAGSVLAGHAGAHSDINLHVFADAPEEISLFLMDANVPFEQGHRNFRFSRNDSSEVPVYRFVAGDEAVELAVFPLNGLRQAPLSPVNGRPMARAGIGAVEALLAEEAEVSL